MKRQLDRKAKTTIKATPARGERVKPGKTELGEQDLDRVSGGFANGLVEYQKADGTAG
jgi:hypothetical protein